jgi:hypothetical protein
LDPITVAGSINVRKLRSCACAFAIIAFELILCDDLTHFVTGPLTSIERSSKRTDDQFNVSILKLIDWGVLEPWPAKPPRALCKYFEVRKTENNRAIGDARTANLLFRRPPAVGLPFLPRVLNLMHKIGVKFFVTGDWRHYFYQIAITDELSRFFEINSGFLQAQFKVLPMGFAWSPFVAQALGWSIILAREDNQSSLGVDEEVTRRENIPEIVILREEGRDVGIIVLWYDNVLVATTKEGLAHRWYSRLRKNGERFNAVWKELSTPSTQAEYIGLALNADPSVRWRHKDSKPGKWLSRANSPVVTPKDIAALVGILIWDATVSMTPLLHYFDEIHLLRKWSPKCKTKKDWNEPITFEENDIIRIEQLKMAVRTICSNEWVVPKRIEISSNLFLASDASDRRAGVVFLNGSVTKPLWMTHRFKERARHSSIFMKELMAVLLAVRFARKHCSQPWERCHLHIAVDNTAAIGAIEKGYSPNKAACIVIKAILDLIPISRLTIKYVKSEDNSADEPSRRKRLVSSKIRKNLDLLQGRFEYPRTSTLKNDREDGFHQPLKGCLKHASRDALLFIQQTEELNPPGDNEPISIEDIVR